MAFENSLNVKSFGATGDGVTDDSAAVMLAFNEAQSTGLGLHFPIGVYNLNNLTLDAAESLRIVGDGKNSTVLHNPGKITCRNDVEIESITLYKEAGTAIQMEPPAGVYSNVYVNNVKAYNDREESGMFGFIYCLINHITDDRGVDNVVFTNNEISNAQYGLRLLCGVRSGAFAANNRIHNLAHSDPTYPLYGIAMGYVDVDTNATIVANNVTVVNNTIQDMLVPAGVDQFGYGICIQGRNIKVLNNHVENVQVYAGLYSKGYGIIHRGNTLINAGRRNNICIKNFYAADGDILIENNTIISMLDDTNSYFPGFHVLGIDLETTNFIVRNNKLTMLSNYTGYLESAAIWTNYRVQKGVIEGNTIYTERGSAIAVTNGLEGTLAIENNNVTQHMQSINSAADGRFLYWKGTGSNAEIICKNNTFNIEKGGYLLHRTNAVPGDVLTMTGNTIDIRTSSVNAINLSDATLNLLHNTVNLNANPESAVRAGSLATGAKPSAPYRVEDNIINCKAPDMGYLFTMPSMFAMLRNQINFDPGCALLAVVNYAPSANAGSYDITTVADNILGNIQEAISSGTVNADYFIRANLSGGFAFPEIIIRDNFAAVRHRLINRSASGGGIPSTGAIMATYNSVYSTLYNDNETVIIDTALREPNLVLASNTSLR